MAIGARSQSARTYLEKNLDKFPSCTFIFVIVGLFYAHLIRSEMGACAYVISFFKLNAMSCT